jgi:hypothetical protein
MAKLDNTKVVTNEVRFSYAHVWEPQVGPNGGDPKYSVTLLIPKTDKDTLSAIDKAVETAKENGKTKKWGGKIPAKLITTLHDGDEDYPDDPVYAGNMYIAVRSDSQPKIVDDAVRPILDQDEFYSGCYGRASISFFPYDNQGGKGVSAGLNNLQKLRDGERLAGGSSPDEDFRDDSLD